MMMMLARQLGGLERLRRQGRPSCMPTTYQEFVEEYFHFVFNFYGRALFYVFCATLLLLQWPFVPDMIVGVYMTYVAYL